MAQALLAYLLVATAAGWVVWSLFMPKPVRRALKARLAGGRAIRPGKGGCACGDGGCDD